MSGIGVVAAPMHAIFARATMMMAGVTRLRRAAYRGHVVLCRPLDHDMESTVGQSRITLQFGLDRNIDGAARDVQAAINAARADLPASEPDLPQGQPGRVTAARRDPDRQAGRLDRPGEPGTVPVWRRRRLESGRNGRPRHRLRHPLQADARIHRGDEGDLDETGGRIPWGVRPVRSDDRPAQTGAETTPAHPCRRRLPAWRTPRDPLWRWLDSNGPWRYRRGSAEIPRDGAGDRPRSGFH